MTPEELQAIRERADNATPGPWNRHILYGDICGLNGEELFYGADDDGTVWARELDDAIFATRARTDIPDLLDHVDALTARLAAVQVLHQPRTMPNGSKWCTHCFDTFGLEETWPCATIQALDGTPPDPPSDPVTLN